MAVSLKLIRRLIMDQIEPRSSGVATTTASGGASTVSCSAFAMTGGDSRVGDGGWINFVTGVLAPESRPIARGGLALGTGDLDMGNAFSGATPSGAEIEFHGRYPSRRDAGTPWVAGYLEMINDAHRKLWFKDDISIAAVTSQVQYTLDLVTHPYLSDPSRILNVLDPEDTSTSERRVRNGRWSIHDDAEAPKLILHDGGYETGKTFYLQVARPAYSRIKVGGVTWTDITPASLNLTKLGLALDTDETHANIEDIVAIAITDSMNALGMSQPSIDKDDWNERRIYWASVAAACKFRRLPKKHDGNPRIKAVAVGGGMMGRGGVSSKTWGNW